MFGLDLKYIVIMALVVIAIISGLKKLFKLTITIIVACVLYYLYTRYIG